MKDDEQKEKVSERSRNRVYRTGGGKGRQNVYKTWIKKARMEKFLKRRTGGGKGSYSSSRTLTFANS